MQQPHLGLHPQPHQPHPYPLHHQHQQQQQQHQQHQHQQYPPQPPFPAAAHGHPPAAAAAPFGPPPQLYLALLTLLTLPPLASPAAPFPRYVPGPLLSLNTSAASAAAAAAASVQGDCEQRFSEAVNDVLLTVAASVNRQASPRDNPGAHSSSNSSSSSSSGGDDSVGVLFDECLLGYEPAAAVRAAVDKLTALAFSPLVSPLADTLGLPVSVHSDADGSGSSSSSSSDLGGTRDRNERDRARDRERHEFAAAVASAIARKAANDPGTVVIAATPLAFARYFDIMLTHITRLSPHNSIAGNSIAASTASMSSMGDKSGAACLEQTVRHQQRLALLAALHAWVMMCKGAIIFNGINAANASTFKDHERTSIICSKCSAEFKCAEPGYCKWVWDSKALKTGVQLLTVTCRQCAAGSNTALSNSETGLHDIASNLTPWAANAILSLFLPHLTVLFPLFTQAAAAAPSSTGSARAGPVALTAAAAAILGAPTLSTGGSVTDASGPQTDAETETEAGAETAAEAAAVASALVIISAAEAWAAKSWILAPAVSGVGSRVHGRKSLKCLDDCAAVTHSHVARVYQLLTVTTEHPATLAQQQQQQQQQSLGGADVIPGPGAVLVPTLCIDGKPLPLSSSANPAGDNDAATVTVPPRPLLSPQQWRCVDLALAARLARYTADNGGIVCSDIGDAAKRTDCNSTGAAGYNLLWSVTAVTRELSLAALARAHTAAAAAAALETARAITAALRKSQAGRGKSQVASTDAALRSDADSRNASSSANASASVSGVSVCYGCGRGGADKAVDVISKASADAAKAAADALGGSGAVVSVTQQMRRATQALWPLPCPQSPNPTTDNTAAAASGSTRRGLLPGTEARALQWLLKALKPHQNNYSNASACGACNRECPAAMAVGLSAFAVPPPPPLARARAAAQAAVGSLGEAVECMAASDREQSEFVWGPVNSNAESNAHSSSAASVNAEDKAAFETMMSELYTIFT